MKTNRTILICAAVLFSVIFIACKSTGVFEGRSKKLELRGNPTTGYTWEYEIENETVCDVKENIVYLGADGIEGAPSLFNYEITGTMPGTTKVIFKYHRPWLENSEIDSRVYEVRVAKSGKLRVKRI